MLFTMYGEWHGPSEVNGTVHSLPLVQLRLLRPIVTELELRGLDADCTLKGVGLMREAVMDGDAEVHVMVIHQFLENAALAADDRTLCATVGAKLDIEGWPFLKRAFRDATTFGDFLSIYISDGPSVATSIQAYLEVRSDRAVFGQKRLFAPSVVPAQNDAFQVGLFCTVLKRLLGERLRQDQLRVVLSDPAALTEDLRQMNCMQGDSLGFSIHFPSSWLTERITDTAAPASLFAASHYDQGFLVDLRRLLGQQAGNGKLTADDVAALTHLPTTRLARHLKRLGTSISQEITRASMEFAKSRLQESTLSVAEIASALGFSDTANFTRAFRNSVGIAPTTFREQAVKGSRQSPGDGAITTRIPAHSQVVGLTGGEK